MALAAYAGATIAQANLMQTGNTAFRLGAAKALVPFVFMYAPSMLLVLDGFTSEEFFIATGGCALGVQCLVLHLPVILSQKCGSGIVGCLV